MRYNNNQLTLAIVCFTIIVNFVNYNLQLHKSEHFFRLAVLCNTYISEERDTLYYSKCLYKTLPEEEKMLT